MDFDLYLDKFEQVADRLNKRVIAKKKIEVAVGIYQDSVFLKLFKKEWATPFQDPLTANSRIFFSVWVSDSIVKEEKIYYNIHALKLRQLSGYAITSRNFADIFRKKFKVFDHEWPNIGVKFGPLTLMQGWVKADPKDFEDETLKLANQFLEIDHIIDEILEKFKKKKK